MKDDLTPFEVAWRKVIRENTPKEGHLTDDQLKELAASEERAKQPLYAHVVECSVCQEKLVALLKE